MYESKKRDFFENLIMFLVSLVLIIGIYFMFFGSNFKLNIDISSYSASISKQIDLLWSNTRFAQNEEINTTEVIEDNVTIIEEEDNKIYLAYKDDTKEENKTILLKNNQSVKEIDLSLDEIVVNKKKEIEDKKPNIIKNKKIKKQNKKIKKQNKIEKKIKNIEKNTNSVSKIRILLDNIKYKINKNISKLKKYKIQNAYVNIRVTILKNGKYEQLTFMDGDKKYYKYIKSTILKSFPIKIDKKLKHKFPRYFRMKIKN